MTKAAFKLLKEVEGSDETPINGNTCREVIAENIRMHDAMCDSVMRAFSASDAACYLWPDDSAEHKALRAAYIRGAADTALTAGQRE